MLKQADNGYNLKPRTPKSTSPGPSLSSPIAVPFPPTLLQGCLHQPLQLHLPFAFLSYFPVSFLASGLLAAMTWIYRVHVPNHYLAAVQLVVANSSLRQALKYLLSGVAQTAAFLLESPDAAGFRAANLMAVMEHCDWVHCVICLAS